jgi:hypothetical protein
MGEWLTNLTASSGRLSDPVDFLIKLIKLVQSVPSNGLGQRDCDRVMPINSKEMSVISLTINAGAKERKKVQGNSNLV